MLKNRPIWSHCPRGLLLIVGKAIEPEFLRKRVAKMKKLFVIFLGKFCKSHTSYLLGLKPIEMAASGAGRKGELYGVTVFLEGT